MLLCVCLDPTVLIMFICVCVWKSTLSSTHYIMDIISAKPYIDPLLFACLKLKYCPSIFFDILDLFGFHVVLSTNFTIISSVGGSYVSLRLPWWRCCSHPGCIPHSAAKQDRRYKNKGYDSWVPHCCRGNTAWTYWTFPQSGSKGWQRRVQGMNSNDKINNKKFVLPLRIVVIFKPVGVSAWWVELSSFCAGPHWLKTAGEILVSSTAPPSSPIFPPCPLAGSQR